VISVKILGFKFVPYIAVKRPVDRLIEHLVRLYEQSADSGRNGQYVLKWLQWLRSGLMVVHKKINVVGRNSYSRSIRLK